MVPYHSTYTIPYYLDKFLTKVVFPEDGGPNNNPYLIEECNIESNSSGLF